MTLSFENLGLIPEILQTVTTLGYTTPTPIQAEAIPTLLAGRDVMGQAQTGTGKTAAFTLPMLQNLEREGLQTLILTPTRELAIQTAEAIHRYGATLGVRVLPVYGGQPYSRQKRRLENGVHVVVGTPGRTLDLINQGALDLSDVHYVVLDEADEMLKMGFIEDVEAILGATNALTRQTALFSATLPDPIRRLANNYMHNPVMVAIEPEHITVENIIQRYYVVRETDKVAALSRILEVEDLRNTLIFTRTKVGAADLAETLFERGYPVEAIHGDLPQPERERILQRFRRGHLTILVATDVVARGVDIPDVSHVINFDIPQLAIEYVHRIGRTGRAGRGGDAITLTTPAQRGHLRQIEAFTRKAMVKQTLPSRETVLARRAEQFKAMVEEQLNADPSESDYALVETLLADGYTLETIASAALKLLRGEESQRPLEEIQPVQDRPRQRSDARQGESRRPDAGRSNADRGDTPRQKRDRRGSEPGMVRLYMDVGRSNGVKPGDIVYGIASQANISGRSIGAIKIGQYETFLDVAEEHVNAVLKTMKNGKIKGQSVVLLRAEGVFDASTPA